MKKYIRLFINKFTSKCKCAQLLPNLISIHISCEHAALNGIPIDLDIIKYCPWCGKRVTPIKKKDWDCELVKQQEHNKK